MTAADQHVVHITVDNPECWSAEWPSEWPSQVSIKQWVTLALELLPPSEVSVCIVDEVQGQALNKQWRGKDAPTNVLSFPAELPDGPVPKPLGDVVLCAPVIAGEAAGQGKSLSDHWAHLLIHGVLHLRGFDHDSEAAADHMERLEVDILKGIGVDDPYLADLVEQEHSSSVTEAGA